MEEKEKPGWISIQFRIRKIDKNILSLRPVDYLIGYYEADIDEFIDENSIHYNDICDVAGHYTKKSSSDFFGFPCEIDKLLKKYNYDEVIDKDITESLLNNYFSDTTMYEYNCCIDEDDIQKKSKNYVHLVESDEKFSIDMYKDFYAAFGTK